MIILLLAVFGAGYGTASLREDEMPATATMEHTMDSMTATLDGKTGDDFDTAFLSEMITHHEGAVQMAEAAKDNAKHDEIKQMANAIIEAQTKEIAQMHHWMTEWYGAH